MMAVPKLFEKRLFDFFGSNGSDSKSRLAQSTKNHHYLCFTIPVGWAVPTLRLASSELKNTTSLGLSISYSCRHSF